MFLDVSHQTHTLSLLARRELVASTLVRIITGLEHHTDGCSLKMKHLAKAICQIPAVRIGQPFGLIAVNDNDRRIASSLMGMP